VAALSVCLIVKNEERHLGRCLDSVAGLAGEIVMVDTGSTDGSREVVVSYGARVFPLDFSFVDFAAARNFAIANARHPWVLMLDADEALDAASVPEVEKLVALSRNAGYFLERHNYWGHADSPTVDYVVRLFPNKAAYRYRGRVHETIDASILANGGALEQAGIRLQHRFSEDSEARRRKNRWYIEILKEEIARDPADSTRLDFLAAEYHQLEMFDEAAAVAEELARVRPNDARAHLFAGVYHLLYKPDLVRARQDFNQALRLRPGYPEAESFLRTLEERENAGANLHPEKQRTN
jgi:glycosyltransferase involved in cell wall biosynthesis